MYTHSEQIYCIIFGNSLQVVLSKMEIAIGCYFYTQNSKGDDFMSRKRKKYPKLPNGYGQIRYLGSNRRNPYGVYPPATEEYPNGQMKPQKALCYVPDWTTGFAVLTAYRAGTYIQGMEKDIAVIDNKQNADTFIQTLLANYNLMQGIEERREKGKTFQEIFKEYYLDKFKEEYGHSGKKKSMEYSMIAAYKNCALLHDREFASLTKNDLQEIVDTCVLKHSSLELIVTLYHQMYRYALANDICEKDYSQFVSIEKEDDDENGVPFSAKDLKTLWKNKDDEVVEFLLIMCYSGFRISAYETIEVNLKDNYFRGGVKTVAGKDRVVPIHSAILPLVKRRIRCHKKILPINVYSFRTQMYNALERLGIEKHTPHDCRHTFSILCEKYEVRENDRKRMLGHSFKDITNKKYGHRELEDLREQIEKIKVDLL